MNLIWPYRGLLDLDLDLCLLRLDFLDEDDEAFFRFLSSCLERRLESLRLLYERLLLLLLDFEVEIDRLRCCLLFFSFLES
jgi:hypothetical protein